jgi:acetamidase/formamidase
VKTALTGRFRLSVRKDMQLTAPRAESLTHYITMGFDEDLDDAVRQALHDMIRWIGELKGLSKTDAYMLCSLAATQIEVFDRSRAHDPDADRRCYGMQPRRTRPSRRQRRM